MASGQDGQLEEEAALIAHDLGIDPQETLRALEADPVIERTKELARTLLGSSFAGTWRSVPASTYLTIAAKDGVPAPVQDVVRHGQGTTWRQFSPR
jgi:hypothetical protein